MDNDHGCAVAMGFLIHGGIIIIFIFIRIHKKAIAIDIFFLKTQHKCQQIVGMHGRTVRCRGVGPLLCFKFNYDHVSGLMEPVVTERD
jgi:hypothetical protein